MTSFLFFYTCSAPVSMTELRSFITLGIQVDEDQEDAKLAFDWEDDVISKCVLTHEGEIKAEMYKGA